MRKHAVYPGSFDPPHYGHMYVLQEAMMIFDKVTILITENSAKKHLFNLEQRMEMWQSILDNEAKRLHTEDEVDICTATNELTVDWMKDRDLQFMIRGVRNSRDFDEEMNLWIVNYTLNKGISTIFIPPIPGSTGTAISSSIVRELMKYKDKIDKKLMLREYVPQSVVDKIYGI